MQIPKHIEIKDATGKRVAFLSPQADGLKSVSIDVRLNGESTLEFLLPATSEKIADITPECQIWAGGRVYTILKDDATDTVRDDNNKLWSKFMAVERWKELEASFKEPYISNDPLTPTPADLAVIIVGGGSDLSGGRYAVGTAAHALYAILQGSEWTLGTCDVTGIHDLEAEKVSRLELVKMVQDIWGGYLVWDSVNKTVSLRGGGKWQNYTGFQIRYAKNLKHITRTQSNRIITKLYGFGKDDLDFASVNSGKKFVTNNIYTSREYIGIYKNQDITNAQELKDKTLAELALVCRPRYLYRVKAVDLRTLPEYSHEEFTLGDMADVVDPDVAPDKPRVRIIRHKYNLFQPWKCEFDIGDPEERLIEQLKASFDVAGYINSILSSRGQLSGYMLEDESITSAKVRELTADKIITGTLDAEKVNVINLKAQAVVTNNLITQNLYSVLGRIADLTVNELDTSYKKITNYLEEDTSPVYYKRDYEQYSLYRQADTDGLQSEQYKSKDGTLLYWTNADYNEMTTDITSLPVMVYKYEEHTKMELSFREVNGDVRPRLILGAGFGNELFPERGKFIIDKMTDGGILSYTTADGTEYSIEIGENGIIQNGEEKLTALNFFANGFSADYNSTTVSYRWDKDVDGRITQLEDLYTGETVPVTWGGGSL